MRHCNTAHGYVFLLCESVSLIRVGWLIILSEFQGLLHLWRGHSFARVIGSDVAGRMQKALLYQAVVAKMMIGENIGKFYGENHIFVYVIN